MARCGGCEGVFGMPHANANRNGARGRGTTHCAHICSARGVVQGLATGPLRTEAGKPFVASYI
jgi:hypothetical protein